MKSTRSHFSLYLEKDDPENSESITNTNRSGNFNDFHNPKLSKDNIKFAEGGKSELNYPANSTTGFPIVRSSKYFSKREQPRDTHLNMNEFVQRQQNDHLPVKLQLPVRFANLFNYAAERIEIYDGFKEELGEYQVETVNMQEELFINVSEREELTNEVDEFLNRNGYKVDEGADPFDEEISRQRLNDVRELFTNIEDKIEESIMNSMSQFKKDKESLDRKVQRAQNQVGKLTTELESKENELDDRKMELEDLHEMLRKFDDDASNLADNLNKHKLEKIETKGKYDMLSQKYERDVKDLSLENKDQKVKLHDLNSQISKLRRDYETKQLIMENEKENIEKEFVDGEIKLTELEQTNAFLRNEKIKSKQLLGGEELRNKILAQEFKQLEENHKKEKLNLQENYESLVQQITKMRMEEHDHLASGKIKKVLDSQDVSEVFDHNLGNAFDNMSCLNIPDLNDNDDDRSESEENPWRQKFEMQRAGSIFDNYERNISKISLTPNNEENMKTPINCSVNDLLDVGQSSGIIKLDNKGIQKNEPNKHSVLRKRESDQSIFDTDCHVKGKKYCVDNNDLAPEFGTQSTIVKSVRTIIDRIDKINAIEGSCLEEDTNFSSKLLTDRVPSISNSKRQSGNFSQKSIRFPENRSSITVSKFAIISEKFRHQEVQTDLTYEQLDKDQYDLIDLAEANSRLSKVKAKTTNSDVATMCIDARAKRQIEQEDKFTKQKEWDKILVDNSNEDLDMFADADVNHEKSSAMNYQLQKLKAKYNKMCTFTKELKEEYNILETEYREKITFYLELINNLNKNISNDKTKIQNLSTQNSPNGSPTNNNKKREFEINIKTDSTQKDCGEISTDENNTQTRDKEDSSPLREHRSKVEVSPIRIPEERLKSEIKRQSKKNNVMRRGGVTITDEQSVTDVQAMLGTYMVGLFKTLTLPKMDIKYIEEEPGHENVENLEDNYTSVKVREFNPQQIVDAEIINLLTKRSERMIDKSGLAQEALKSGFESTKGTHRPSGQITEFKPIMSQTYNSPDNNIGSPATGQLNIITQQCQDDLGNADIPYKEDGLSELDFELDETNLSAQENSTKAMSKLISKYKIRLSELDNKYNTLMKHYNREKEEIAKLRDNYDEKFLNNLFFINNLNEDLHKYRKRSRQYRMYQDFLVKKHGDGYISEKLKEYPIDTFSLNTSLSSMSILSSDQSVDYIAKDGVTRPETRIRENLFNNAHSPVKIPGQNNNKSYSENNLKRRESGGKFSPGIRSPLKNQSRSDDKKEARINSKDRLKSVFEKKKEPNVGNGGKGPGMRNLGGSAGYKRSTHFQSNLGRIEEEEQECRSK